MKGGNGEVLYCSNHSLVRFQSFSTCHQMGNSTYHVFGVMPGVPPLKKMLSQVTSSCWHRADDAKVPNLSWPSTGVNRERVLHRPDEQWFFAALFVRGWNNTTQLYRDCNSLTSHEIRISVNQAVFSWFMSLEGFHNCSDGIIKARNDNLLISMDTISTRRVRP